MAARIVLTAFLLVAAAAAGGEAAFTAPAVRTVTPTLPADKAGYFYAASADPVASIADVATFTRLDPINPGLLPRLVIDVPEEVELLAAIRKWDVKKQGLVDFNGRKRRRYRVVPREGASKHWLFWRTSLPAGTRFDVRFFGEWDANGDVPGGRQPDQTLEVEVVALPERPTFKRLKVWYTIPSDAAAAWDPAAYRRGGFNAVDLWGYLSPEERSWGEPLLRRTAAAYREAGVEVWGWPQDWWWRRAKQDADGRSAGEGGAASEDLHLLYRGRHFADWMDAGRALIDAGVTTHTCDPEIYRDPAVGGTPDEEAAFARWRAATGWPDEPDARRLWAAARYTDFFAEYRAAMEQHMRATGVPGPFRFVIYSTYHRHWDSFHGAEGVAAADPSVRTLEDPRDLRRAFDVMSPMTYPDIYGDGRHAAADRFDRVNRLGAWEDASSLRKPFNGPVMPLLSTGYPHGYYASDTTPAMIASQMVQCFAAGAAGIGFWGEGVHDARDMETTARVVAALVPFEETIENGKPFAEDAAGGVVVRGVTDGTRAVGFAMAPDGGPAEAVIERPCGGRVRDLLSGEVLAEAGAGPVRIELRGGERLFTVSP